MPARFQVVETMMWTPPSGVDHSTVRFHVDQWRADGRPLDLDDVLERRADVIAEWQEPDASPEDLCDEFCCVSRRGGSLGASRTAGRLIGGRRG